MSKVHKDNPLTYEELTAIKAQLYFVNATNRCANPPHPSWFTAVEDLRRIKARKDTSSYKEWLESELARI